MPRRTLDWIWKQQEDILGKANEGLHGDPVLRNLPSNSGDAGSIPGLCEQGQS